MDNEFDLEKVKTELDLIVQSLRNEKAAWKYEHEEGLKLVKAIGITQSKCITLKNKLPGLRTAREILYEKKKLRRYERRMIKPFDKLRISVAQFQFSNKRSRAMLAPLQSWVLNEKLRDHIFYRDWRLEDILNFAENILSRYEAEYDKILLVYDNLTAARTQDDLNNNISSWETPKHALSQKFFKLFDEFNYETIEVKDCTNN